MLSHEQFLANVARVPSHGTDRHGHLLFGLVRWLRPAVVVEVGACHGYSTCWLARALQENQRERPEEEGLLVVIDDYSLFQNAYPMLWHNLGLCDVGGQVAVSNANSRSPEAWPERVDMAYIDGDHSLDGCRADVEKAISLGATCIAVHDTTNWWGPRRYVEEHFPAGWTEVSVGFDQGFTVMMKRPEKGPIAFTEERYPEGHI